MNPIPYEEITEPGAYLVVAERRNGVFHAGALRLPDNLGENFTAWPDDVAEAINCVVPVSASAELTRIYAATPCRDTIQLVCMTAEKKDDIAKVFVDIAVEDRFEAGVVARALRCLRQFCDDLRGASDITPTEGAV